MEAHELSYAVAGPILKRIQAVRLEKKELPIGSEMHIVLDNQLDLLLTQLTNLFLETEPIYHNKFGSEPGEIDDSPDVPVSNGPNYFDLSGALGAAVNGEANLTEVDTPVETSKDKAIREEKDEKFVDKINAFYAGKRTRRKSKKTKNTKNTKKTKKTKKSKR
jgi:hypothetical protein